MKRTNITPIFILAGLLALNSCANTGMPGGGPKDVTPPRLLKSVPLRNQLNYNRNRVEISFNELVALQKPSQKVIVSPPQKVTPTTKAIANKISVLFADSLLPETTYTIDFTDAIVDYNEGNKFGDYSFSFSTGGKIDSMCVSGTLVDASNLNPVSGVLVGVHADLSDSCFVRVPFRRISRTNQKGFFSIKGLPQGVFQVFALGDKNNDFRFDQPGESIARFDSIVRPWSEPCLKNDTIWKDSLTVDTVMVRNVTCFKPDNLVLRYFTEDFGRQYLSRRQRPSREKILLNFGRKSETLPELKLLNSKAIDWYVLEKNPTNDSLVYWIKDTIVSSMDTLRLKLDYLKTDSLNRLVPATDTISLISRSIKPRAESSDNKRKKDKPSAPVVVPPMALKSDIQATLEIFSKPRFEWETPIGKVHGTPWSLFRKKDSTWVSVPFTFLNDSLHLRDFILDAKWEFGGEYRFDIDSGKVEGIYGKTNDKFSQIFKIREEEDYSRLVVKLSGIRGAGIVELLDKADKVVRRQKLENSQADFKYLLPGSYYIRAIDDRNGNFRWDTGSYAQKRQPEEVYYNPKLLNLRAYGDVEESWNVHEYPLLQQKPKELQPKAANP